MANPDDVGRAKAADKNLNDANRSVANLRDVRVNKTTPYP
jgi:hypothetical protein